jgi:predicted SprT family Zn-dependent metalloprotease
MLEQAPPRLFTAVRRLARDLLDRHGLSDWTFAFNRRLRCLGVCHYRTRTIELSRHFVRLNDGAEIRETLLHEIAHALVGPGHGHDAVWKRKCLEVGCRPERCGHAAMPEGRWKADCPGCGERFHRHRRPRRLRGWFCVECGPADGKLVWRDRAATSAA